MPACAHGSRLETRLADITYHPTGWSVDVILMANNVRELRPRSSDSEKITINLGYVDLGHVDLLVQEKFYSNRTDFIRTAIRIVPTLFGQQFATSLTPKTRRSSS